MKDHIIGVFIIGVLVGMLSAALLIHTSISLWCYKPDVEARKTITQPDYFTQYSAVRRFPR